MLLMQVKSVDDLVYSFHCTVVEFGPRSGPDVSLRNRNGQSITHLKDFGVQPIGPSAMLRDSHGSAEFQPTDKGPSGNVCPSVQPELCKEDNFELEFISQQEKEAGRKQQADSHYSLTDCVLVEEDSRYGSFSNSGGLRDLGSPSPSILFSLGRTPKREFFYHSGALREVCHNGNLLSFQDTAGPNANGNNCWELVEFNGPISVARYSEGGSSQSESQEGRGEREPNWEESSLAKFSQFLGFSTKGLEKEILSFLVKIRKRRQMIHSKGILEKSKFERELKKLECSINYEEEGKKNCPLQGRGGQSVVVQ